MTGEAVKNNLLSGGRFTAGGSDGIPSRVTDSCMVHDTNSSEVMNGDAGKAAIGEIPGAGAHSSRGDGDDDGHCAPPPELRQVSTTILQHGRGDASGRGRYENVATHSHDAVGATVPHWQRDPDVMQYWREGQKHWPDSILQYLPDDDDSDDDEEKEATRKKKRARAQGRRDRKEHELQRKRSR